jgi:hypothetical protein
MVIHSFVQHLLVPEFCGRLILLLGVHVLDTENRVLV